MMTSQILKFVDFTKTQKCRYLENVTFEIKSSLIINKFIKDNFIAKNSFVAEVTLK